MLRRLALAAACLALCLFGQAHAQIAFIAPDVPSGDSSDRIANTKFVQQAVAGVGGSLALQSGRIFIGSAGNIAVGQPVSGDCTISISGAITCLKTNGVAFGALATSAAAAKSDQQAGTSAILPVTPSQQQSHDSATKAWVNFVGATGVINSSYNVTSITRTGTGNYNVTFTTPFANAFYSCTATPETSATASTGQVSDAATLKTATQIRAFAFNVSGGAAVDPTNFNLECHGRQ